MKINCPELLLSKELDILKPNIIIVMGKETLLDTELVVKEIKANSINNNASLYKLTLFHKQYKALEIIHPLARYGSDNSIPNELWKMITNNKFI